MLLYNAGLTNKFGFICTPVIAFLWCILNLYFPASLLKIVKFKNFSFCDWSFFSFVYCIASFSIYLKYSENCAVLFRILCGCHQNIFYTATELNLLLEFLALLYFPNTAGKPQKSQTLTLRSDLSFPKYPSDYQK